MVRMDDRQLMLSYNLLWSSISRDKIILSKKLKVHKYEEEIRTQFNSEKMYASRYMECTIINKLPH